MSARSNILSGKGIFITTCALALVFIGCISIPLGDAEKAKVDEKLLGAWVSQPAEDGNQTLFTIVPYDSRTCLLSQFGFQQDGETIKGNGRFDWKMWVVEIQGTQFISLEMKNAQLALEQEKDRFTCAKIVRTDDAITVQRVKDDFVTGAGVTTPQQLEELIGKNLNNAAMYEEAITLTKVTKEQKDAIGKVFEAFSGNK